MTFLTRSHLARAALALASLALAQVPSEAHACGGCFSPPTIGMPSPVTGHRMAVAMSTSGTTLWDQIQYAGNPEDFVWVLPVTGTPMVELADNGFFEALTQVSTITMTAPLPPQRFCPSSGGCGLGCASSSYSPASAGDAGTAVIVHFEGVVGPYETATIGSTDPMALVTWLQDHGYLVPDAILPTIAHYVSLGSNFTVLRLAPTAGIDRMQPVRVTSPGLSLTFPLRMVAAGVQTTVDLELFVFAEGRMEAANFGNTEVDRDAITFDWTTSTFSYDDEFENALFAGTEPGTAWVTEYAQPAPIAELRAFRSVSGGLAHTAMADVSVVTAAIPEPYVTRLRTRLPPSELDRDLVLRASDGGDIGTSIAVTRELHRAADVRCGGSDCSASASTPGAAHAFLACVALAPLLLAVRRRRR
jgi:hypothetical protein